MREVWRADERYRGGDPEAGIVSWHAFSFAGFYDPDNIRLGALTACNEEQLAPGAGFDSHPHRDLEIVSWVIEGELTHEDTATGSRTVVRPGDVQRLTTGRGVHHSERNDGPAPLRFLQMWLVPREPGGEPEYEVVRGIADGTPYALPRTDAVLHVRRLADAERTAVPTVPFVYLHVVRGAAVVGPTGEEERLTAGDAVRISGGEELAARADGACELLVWELHA